MVGGATDRVGPPVGERRCGTRASTREIGGERGRLSGYVGYGLALLGRTRTGLRGMGLGLKLRTDGGKRWAAGGEGRPG